jgi:hypothetical protein
MPSLPQTLPSLRPHSHASCLPHLVVMLPLVLCRFSFSSCHRLPFGGASTCPLLVVLLLPVVPLFFSGVLASRPPRLFVVSPLMMPFPPICLYLRLSLHCCLSLRPSCVSCPAGCCIASHHADASHPPAPVASGCAHHMPLVHSSWLPCSLFSQQRLASASASATKELSPSCGVDLDCDTKLHVQCQTGNDEKNLKVFRIQTELIGKVAAMVIAHIEHKPEPLGIGEES